MGAGASSSRPFYDSSLSNDMMSKRRRELEAEDSLSPLNAEQVSAMQSHMSNYHIPYPMNPSELNVPYLNKYPFHDYRFLKKVGNGRFSVIYKAAKCEPSKEETTASMVSEERFAIKEISATDMSAVEYEDLRYEISVLSHLQHPHILKLISLYEPPAINSKIYTVYEYLRGGELLTALCQEEQYTLYDILFLFQQCLSALDFLHAHGVVHGNLIPEHLILLNKYNALHRASNVLKLVGFGHAEFYTHKRPIRKYAKENVFTAPERRTDGELINVSKLTADRLAERESFGYQAASDIWSYASILYFLITGSFPLYEGKKLFRKSAAPELLLDPMIGDQLGESAKDFFRAALSSSPLERATAKDLVRHEWIDHQVTSTEVGNIPLGMNLQKLKLFLREKARASSMVVPLDATNLSSPSRLNENKVLSTLLSLNA